MRYLLGFVGLWGLVIGFVAMIAGAAADRGYSAVQKSEPTLPPTQQATKAYQEGLSRLAKGENDAAVAAFTEAIRLDKKAAGTYFARGVAYWKKGNLDAAIADFTEAIRLNPECASAYFNRGNVYEKKGEKVKAEADFTKAEKVGAKPK